MDKILKTIGTMVVVIVLVTVFGLVFSFPTKWIVNYLFSPSALFSVFGVTRFDVWHAWALNAFAGIVFKSTNTGK
jgi:hypothetical protein